LLKEPVCPAFQEIGWKPTLVMRAFQCSFWAYRELILFRINRSGFADFVRPRQFRTYIDYVIEPSYKLHQDLGLLKHTMSGQTLDEQMSFRNFLSGRLLWDESMAYFAYKWTQKNPGGLLIGLVGADHGE